MANQAHQLVFHHIGVAVHDIEKAVPHYRTIFGYDLFDGPYDDPIQRVKVLFMRRSHSGPDDPCIELISPLDKDAPVNRYLSKEVGAYHLCYTIGDIDAGLAALRAAGWLLISGPTPAVGFGGRRIAWLFMPTRQLVELVEAQNPGSA